MKKKVFVVAVVLACIAIAAAGTLAYFTGDVVTHNVITSNEIDISIVEKVPTGSKALPNGGFEIFGAMPDSSVQKEVAVKNEATESAWIRVKLDVSIVNKDGKDISTSIGDTELIDYVYPDNFDDNWIRKDDFYYYKKPLAGNDISKLLIEEVSFAPEMDNPYQGCTVTVAVKAYAVQAKNNMPESGSVLDVMGWPKG